MQITENTNIDGFVIVVIVGFALAIVGMFALFNYSSGIQQEGYADIDRMGCGELKEFILDKGWREYPARTSWIQEEALHTYTWRCEK